VPLTAKFHHPTFNRSEVIVLKNKQTDRQTPLKTPTSLRYATSVGKESTNYSPVIQVLARPQLEYYVQVSKPYL